MCVAASQVANSITIERFSILNSTSSTSFAGPHVILHRSLSQSLVFLPLNQDRVLDLNPLNLFRHPGVMRNLLKSSNISDHLLTPPNEYQSFSSALIAQSASLRVDSEKLNQLLNGYAFLNHFNKSHVKISMELMAKAWNRGAALMCKPCTKSAIIYSRRVSTTWHRNGIWSYV